MKVKISKIELDKIDNCINYFYSCFKSLSVNAKIVLFKRFMNRFKKELNFEVSEDD
jgi:hypothetical protein